MEYDNEKKEKESFKPALCVILYIIFAISGATLIKLSGNNSDAGYEIFGLKLTALLLIGIVLYGLSFLLYISIISKMKISLILPVLTGVNSILVVIVGQVIFHEIITTGQLIGILVVIIGTIMVGSFREKKSL